jgi:hypothetical protein
MVPFWSPPGRPHLVGSSSVIPLLLTVLLLPLLFPLLLILLLRFISTVLYLPFLRAAQQEADEAKVDTLPSSVKATICESNSIHEDSRLQLAASFRKLYAVKAHPSYTPQPFLSIFI